MTQDVDNFSRYYVKASEVHKDDAARPWSAIVYDCACNDFTYFKFPTREEAEMYVKEYSRLRGACCYAIA